MLENGNNKNVRDTENRDFTLTITLTDAVSARSKCLLTDRIRYWRNMCLRHKGSRLFGMKYDATTVDSAESNRERKRLRPWKN